MMQPLVQGRAAGVSSEVLSAPRAGSPGWKTAPPSVWIPLGKRRQCGDLETSGFDRHFFVRIFNSPGPRGGRTRLGSRLSLSVLWHPPSFQGTSLGPDHTHLVTLTVG